MANSHRLNLPLSGLQLAASFLLFPQPARISRIKITFCFQLKVYNRPSETKTSLAMADVTPKTDATSSSMPTATFTVLYFATASSYTAISSEQLPAPLPLARLFPMLESRYPGITAKVLKSCAVTVNLDYVDIEEEPNSKSNTPSEGLLLKSGDEVGIIPPVSSG